MAPLKIILALLVTLLLEGNSKYLKSIEMDKGKQFEHAVCQAAWNMAGFSNLSSSKRSDYDSNQNLISRGTITTALPTTRV